MMHRIARIAAIAIALPALDASAQDVDAFPPATEASTQPPGSAAPAPAPAPTPAPAPAPECAEPRLQPYDLILYADAMAQANRRAREVDRLHAVMNREGQEYSEEKFESYRNRRAAGVVMIVLGASSMFAAMVSGITLETTTSSSDDYDEDGDEYDAHEEDSRSALLPGLPLGLLFSGIAAVAIGVPLTISGARGRKRQAILYRKDEILAPNTPPAAYVSFFADPAQGAGGLQLKVTF